VPDLRRFTRTGTFRGFQSAGASWVERNFRLIESGVPWLVRTGCRVTDRCQTEFAMRGAHPITARWEPPGVRCDRDVTVGYGLDGDLASKLTDLAAVLARAGWGELHDDTTIPIADLAARVPPVWPVRWSPVPGNAHPAALETMPPDRRFDLKYWIEMAIGWSSGEWHADLETTPALVRTDERGAATVMYHPVEVAGPAISDLAQGALAGHEHAVVIRISVCYYLNPNANARPGRLRKRLRPVPRRTLFDLAGWRPG
jgi:hypothetical protein